MKIELEAKKIKSISAVLSRMLPHKRYTIPSLYSVVFRGAAGRLTLSAWDLDHTIELDAGPCDDTFKTAIPWPEFKAAVSSAPAKSVICFAFDADAVTISAAGVSQHIHTIGDYPEYYELGPMNDERAITAGTINHMGALAPLVSEDVAARPAMRGIMISPDGLTATDGRQILHIPAAGISDKARSLEPAPHTSLYMPGAPAHTLRTYTSFYQITSSAGTYTGRIIQATPPNWKHIIPLVKDLKTCITWQDTPALTRYLHKAGRVTLNISRDTVEFMSEASGKITSAPAIISGLQGSIRCEAEYIARALSLGHNTLALDIDCYKPAIGLGGLGTYVFAPLRKI